MDLWVADEFSPLKKVVVCRGDFTPVYEDFHSSDPEFTKFHPYKWDKDLMLRQQDTFFELLEHYDVELIFPKMSPDFSQQMYTRDTAFVIGDKLFYAGYRKRKDRNGEIGLLLQTLQLSDDQVINLLGELEGGDVIVSGTDSCFLGLSSRTNQEGLASLSEYVAVKAFSIGDQVMHLDTRLTILPNNVALVHPESFMKDHLEYLSKRFSLIEITTDEANKLGSNVFVINPETIVAPTEHPRIADQLKQHGFKVEILNYSEPINQGGSFRCTTLPLVREK